MAEHAILSPSAAERWTECPGSVELCEGLPDTESQASRDGTEAHDIAAGLLSVDVVVRRGARGRRLALPSSMRECVDAYVGYVQALQDIYEARAAVETKVVLLPKWCWGTADAILRAFEPDGRIHLHVVDLKTGGGHFVPAVRNRQLAVYGLAALRGADLSVVSAVSLHIVQPRWQDSDGIARVWTLTPAELEAFLAPTLQAARTIASGAKGLPLVPGEHCTFCRARATCPALQRQVESAVQASFAAVPLEPPQPATMSPEQIGKVLGAASVIEVWLKAVRERAHQMALDGQHVPGHKLVERVGNRKWIDDASAADMLRSIGVDPYTEPKLVTPAEAERRAGRARKDAIAPLTTKPINGVALVPETDKRPAIAADVVASFRALPLPFDAENL